MSLAPPGGFSWLSLTRSASAGGQLEHPSDVNNSTTTGVCAQAPETLLTRSATNANKRTENFFIMHDETHRRSISFRMRGEPLAAGRPLLRFVVNSQHRPARFGTSDSTRPKNGRYVLPLRGEHGARCLEKRIVFTYVVQTHGTTETSLTGEGIPFATTSKMPVKPVGTFGQSKLVETGRSPVATPMVL